MFALQNLNRITFGLVCHMQSFWFNLNACFAEFESIHSFLQVLDSCWSYQSSLNSIISLIETLNWFKFLLILFILHPKLLWIKSKFLSFGSILMSTQFPHFALLNRFNDSLIRFKCCFSIILRPTYSYLPWLYILASTHSLISICQNTINYFLTL